MTTDAQLIAWLKKDAALRCVLVEVTVNVGGVETVRYLSDRGYASSPTAAPANTMYTPLINGGLKFTESLSLDGSPSVSFGTIELANIGGEIDSWIDDVWTNRSIKMFIGNLTWSRQDFYQIFDGIVADVDTPSRDKVVMKISDKLQRLNTSVSDVTLGGTTVNSDKLRPLLFGECHNITPLLADAATEKYMVHDGPIERVIEVRDNGAPVNFTADIGTGTFTLNQAAVGTITCSAQGYKPLLYSNNIFQLIVDITKNYGTVGQRLTDDDIDYTNMSAMAASATGSPVGIFLSEKANVLEVCNSLAASVGARLVFDRLGKLYCVKLDLQGVTGGTVITKDDIEEWSLDIADRPEVVAATKIGYCKNYTTQTALADGLPPNIAELYGQVWITTTAKDATVAERYKLYTETTIQETQLLTTASAEQEAARRLTLFKTQRKVLRYKGLGYLLLERLGNPQTLIHNRFGLSAGKAGQVISISKDWFNAKVDFEVLI